MISPYIEAKEICMKALRRFRDDVNDYLPDYRMSRREDETYLIQWDVNTIEEVYQIFKQASDRILSTVMANHFTCEINICDGRFCRAIKDKSITDGQTALASAVECFRDIHTVLRRVNFSR